MLMKRFTRRMGLILVVLALAATAGATVHNVTVSNFQFSPANLTVAQGDTVTWTNSGGFHNVHHNATPSLFGCAEGNAPWTYSFAFNVPAGSYPYICQVHPSQMNGTVTVQAPSSAPDPQAPAMQLDLEQNYPNPFNSTTSIAFALPVQSRVQLTVLNVLGQTVAELYNGQLDQGSHQITFDASGLGSGMYYYKLVTPYAAVTRRMFYLK